MQKARRHSVNGTPTACKRMVSGTISLFFQKFFSPFPHGTGSLSVSQEYLALPDGPGRFTQNFTSSALLRIPLGNRNYYVYRTITFYGQAFQHGSTFNSVIMLSPTTPYCLNNNGLGCSRSIASTQGITFVFFSSGYLDVSVHRVCFSQKTDNTASHLLGCPIRKSSDIIVICTSPKLIAAYHVLHRL
jgi:hypothetical protein